MAKDIKKPQAKTTDAADNQKVMPFGRMNYILVIVGIALIALGFILMIGGGSSNPDDLLEREKIKKNNHKTCKITKPNLDCLGKRPTGTLSCGNPVGCRGHKIMMF